MLLQLYFQTTLTAKRPLFSASPLTHNSHAISNHLKLVFQWTLKTSPPRNSFRMTNLHRKDGRFRCAIYSRVSTHDQMCDRQIADLTSYADRCNYNVVSIHRETASGAKLDRQVRKAVIDSARARRIDIILVSELTRWGRSTIDLIASLQQLQSWEVSPIAQNGFQFDLSTPHGY